MRIGRVTFRAVWLVDFEFYAAPGERVTPLCMVARSYPSGETIRLWAHELARLEAPPFAIDRQALFVAYYASAEMACFLALGWPMPSHILDLFVEFRNRTNGIPTPCGAGLLGALAFFGAGCAQTVEKKAMQALAQRGGPWSADERQALLAYCETDVVALAHLLEAMTPGLDLPRAILRGRYMKAAARMEHNGIPLDKKAWLRLKSLWPSIQDRLIGEIDQAYHLFEGRTFKKNRFAAWLVREGLPWPHLDSGALDLSEETFREMARAFPQVAPLHALRATLAHMRRVELAVGRDGRNRCLLSAFRARTGRNQPSTTRFVFGPSVWMRSLIRPEPGQGLAYIDWSQQEFGIAAALSRDPTMMAAYRSGDPYLAFAKQAGAVPETATRKSHPAQRDQFKACVLAVQYGMGAASLAVRIGQPTLRARELLDLHRRTYPVFWAWSDGAVDHAMLHGSLWTTFGWTVKVDKQPNPRFLRNFLMQANGAEMLRLACCLATERGIRVCAPIHDALLIEAPLSALEATIAQTQALMAEASAVVLEGFVLRSDVESVPYPQRYVDARGQAMWDTVWRVMHAQDPPSLGHGTARRKGAPS